jgi:integrase
VKIAEHAFWMKREGYRDSTIRAAVRALRSIGRRCNLLDPNAFKDYVAKAEYSENRRDHILDDAKRFYSWSKVEFTKPMSRRVQKFPFIPTEAEVNALTSAVGPKLSAYMRLVKETGARAGEVWQLQWADLDPNTSTITINPEKGSRPRRPKISGSAMASVLALPRTSPFVFHRADADPEISYQHFFRNYAKQRARIAVKLQNPRLRSISFKTLRHFKATMEYHRTKDILHVMEILGHKNIRNTLMYTHLVNWESEEFVSNVAKTVKEAQELVESGFEYVCDVEEYKVFRKRK